MSRKRKNNDLGIQWYLPNSKRPFASTPLSDSDWVEACADDGLTWSQVRDATNYPSTELMVVMNRFIDAGYEDTPCAEHVGSYQSINDHRYADIRDGASMVTGGIK
jgi:hypothetical protein